jgi:hypothetical protein
MTAPSLPIPMDPQALAHLNPTLFPRHKADELVLGQKIRYRDKRTGQIMECTVEDSGTSRLRGNWFLVLYGPEEREVEVTATQMEEMLVNRVE